MSKPLDRALVWLRRDLRVDDHAALHHALRAARQVHLGFVFGFFLTMPYGKFMHGIFRGLALVRHSAEMRRHLG